MFHDMEYVERLPSTRFLLIGNEECRCPAFQLPRENAAGNGLSAVQTQTQTHCIRIHD